MHELSLAHDIVDTAAEAAARVGAERVRVVTVRVGRFSGVEAGALVFSWDTATLGTVLEGSTLSIIDVPLVVWCAYCLVEVAPPALNHLVCPRCGTPAGEIRSGRELDVDSLEVEP